MGEFNRHGLRAAICGVLAAGALAAVPAMAHNDDVDQPDATAATSQTSATSSGTTTSGYGAVTDASTDADQSRSDPTTASSSSTGSTTSSTPSSPGGTSPTSDSTGMSTPSTNSTFGSTATSTPSSTNTTAGSTATNSPSSTASASASTDSTGPNRADLYSTGQPSDEQSRMTTEADQANRTQASNSGAGTRTDVVWYILPVTLKAQSDQMSKGCWVQLYSGDDFEGRYVSVVGPAYIHEMGSPYGTGMNNWESAVVGPNATVTTYDGENFQSRNAVLRAGQRYADLDDSKLGLFDDIESMKVDCTQSSQPGR